MSKLIRQRMHAKRRASERFDIAINRTQLRDLARQIQDGKAAFVMRQSLRVTVWRVTLPDGRSAQAVYDTKRHQIVTFLSDDMDPAGRPYD